MVKSKLRDFLVGSVYRIFGTALRPIFRAKRSRTRPERILILKPCCIGDVLMSTALVAELRMAYPEAAIHYAVGTWSRDAISHNHRIDALIDCGGVGSGSYSWNDYRSLVQKLNEGRYGTCFVLERSAPLILLPFFAGIPHRIGIDSGGRGFSLTLGVLWKTMRHEADLYLDLVRALGISPDHPTLEFFPSDADCEWAKSRLSEMESNEPESKPCRFVAVHPGGAANPGMSLYAKRWPVERYAGLLERFLADDWKVILVGAESDRTIVEQLRGILERTPVSTRLTGSLLNLCGETDLGKLGAVYKSCDLFVGNDTGPMHLAVACGIPVVAVFGPSTPLMYGPFSPRSIAVYKQVDCSPCFLNGSYATACVDHRCMEAIGVEDVWSATESLMNAKGGTV